MSDPEESLGEAREIGAKEMRKYRRRKYGGIGGEARQLPRVMRK